MGLIDIGQFQDKQKPFFKQNRLAVATFQVKLAVQEWIYCNSSYWPIPPFQIT